MKEITFGAIIAYRVTRCGSHSDRRDAARILWNALANRQAVVDVHDSNCLLLENGMRCLFRGGKELTIVLPDVETPRELAAYDSASEQILLRAKAESETNGLVLNVTKGVNCGNLHMPHTWRQQETYCCRSSLWDSASQLLGHIASRSPYASSGYLSTDARGMGFELTQLGRHLTRAVVTNAENNSDICFGKRVSFLTDSQRSPFGIYLRYGVTGTLLMLLSQGHNIGDSIRLDDPRGALRAISLDPWVQSRVRLSSGRMATAIDIQRMYAVAVRPLVETGDYPDWVHEVVEIWCDTLDQLEHAPQQLDDKLDAYIKLGLFDAEVAGAGMTWAQVREALEALGKLRLCTPEVVVAALVSGESHRLSGDRFRLFRELLSRQSFKRNELEALRFAYRLQVMDNSFQQLGGLYDQLMAGGKVSAVVINEQQVQTATHQRPA